MGVPQMGFQRNLAPDFGGIDWRSKRDKYKEKRKFRIMILGKITTTVNDIGLRYFADKIAPELIKNLTGEYEVHICGSGTPSPDLASKLSHKNIIFRGFIDDLSNELLSTDVFLIPTPIKLGGRVRVSYAWSAGCCVIAHEANNFGLVEMKNGENAILGKNGKQFTNAIEYLYKNPNEARKMEDASRKAFETYYNDKKWAQLIVDRITSASKDRIN